MNDRRRINGPCGGTTAPLFSKSLSNGSQILSEKLNRRRHPNALRRIFLKTGVTPSASGSAYLELESLSTNSSLTVQSFPPFSASGLKLSCTVHGPRALPRSAPFSPTIILSTHVKYAPFATSQRKSYMRDVSERDLAIHLETALRGVIIGDRWPKSGVEVIVTILEGEDDCWWDEDQDKIRNLGTTNAKQLATMNALNGCITVASAAIADAGIDCLDMVCGGVAALVRDHNDSLNDLRSRIVLDPVASEHCEVLAICVVGYLPSRDKITDLWVRGYLAKPTASEAMSKDSAYEELTDKAIQAALAAHRVIAAAVREAAVRRMIR